MKEDFSELVEYLDKKFGEVATKADVDRRFDVVVREVVSLRTDTETRFTDLRKSFGDLQDAVGVYATKADLYFQEMAAMSQKLQRLERWVEELAAKVGMKLKS